MRLKLYRASSLGGGLCAHATTGTTSPSAATMKGAGRIMESLLAWSMDHGSAAAQWRPSAQSRRVRFRRDYHRCSTEERPPVRTHGCAKGCRVDAARGLKRGSY